MGNLSTAVLLGLNGLRVSEACDALIAHVGGARYAPTLRIIGKGDKPAKVALNPRTQYAIDLAIGSRTDGRILLNEVGVPPGGGSRGPDSGTVVATV